MFHVHKSAIQENNFKEHVNFYTGPAPSEDFVTLYTTPQKREWVGLTDEEVIECLDSVALGVVETEKVINKHLNVYNAAKAIEAKLKEKNT